MKQKHAYLVGKGKSLDNVTSDWFSRSGDVYCLNQAADVIARILTKSRLHCVQNDAWINYQPPDGVAWHCGATVDTHGRKAEKYLPQQLTGKWANPTCMCALQLMLENRATDVTMIGFDSHFDGSKAYADKLKVKSDEIAPYDFYDSIMRRFAATQGIKLNWVDAGGNVVADDFKLKKCLISVSVGDKYIKQTEGMVKSFLRHNPDWDAARFYDDDLNSILPQECRRWSAFNRCEIGRWFAAKKCLEAGYDCVLYSDGDIRWYGKHEPNLRNDMTIYPHYVTDRARQNAKHGIMKDGAANIGIFELNRSIDHGRIFDFILGEVMHAPRRFMHGDQLWLQNLISCLPDCGFDCAYNIHAGYNVACWNLRRQDRAVFKENGEYRVRTDNGFVFPLKSFHFSSKSLGLLDVFGDAVRELKKEYLNE